MGSFQTHLKRQYNTQKLRLVTDPRRVAAVKKMLNETYAALQDKTHFFTRPHLPSVTIDARYPPNETITY